MSNDKRKMPGSRGTLLLFLSAIGIVLPFVLLNLLDWISLTQCLFMFGSMEALLLWLAIAGWRSETVRHRTWRVLSGLVVLGSIAMICIILTDPPTKHKYDDVIAPVIFLFFIVLPRSLYFLFTGGVSEAPDDIPEKDIKGDCYIQRADNSLEEIADQSEAGIVRTLLEYNWAGELENYRSLGKRKGMLPSLFLGKFGDPHFIDINIIEVDTIDVTYFRLVQREGKKPKKVQEELYKKGLSFRTAEDIIKAYFKKDEAELVRLLQ